MLCLSAVANPLGERAFLGGATLAILPVPLYVALALWLDRFEAEPGWMLARSFFWGATSAAFTALVVNSTVAGAVGRLLGPAAGDAAGSLLSAPIVEEAAKAFVLFSFFRRYPDEFDNLTDGVVYAAMVGLGFACMENVAYYAEAIVRGGSAPAATFVARGILSPFAHPLFTAMTGIGLGLARETGHASLRRTAPLLGYACAVTLHFLWNLSAQLDDFRAVYAVVMVPAFVAVLVVVARSLRREARVVRTHLQPLVHGGILSGAELATLCTGRGRLRETARALLGAGPAACRRTVRYHAAAGELAFHRWRTARGISAGPDADAARDRELLEAMLQHRPRTRRAPAVQSTSGNGGSPFPAPPTTEDP